MERPISPLSVVSPLMSQAEVSTSTSPSKGSGPGNGVANRMQYTNPALDRAFLSGVTRMDDTLRAKELAEAMRLGIQDLATIPVVFAGYNWAARRDRVVMEPNVLGFTQAMLMKPAR